MIIKKYISNTQNTLRVLSYVVLMKCVCLIVCVGYADNNIGHIGAQSIGDGLKSLTSLTTLDLRSERCCDVCGCVCLFVCVCVFVRVRVDCMN